MLFVFVFVSNFLCLSIRYSIRLLGKFLTNWLTQTLKFRRVPLLILPEFQPKIRIFELWSPNSDIRIRIRRISNDVKLFVFVFVWFFLLINIRNSIRTNFQQIFNTALELTNTESRWLLIIAINLETWREPRAESECLSLGISLLFVLMPLRRMLMDTFILNVTFN